MPNMHDMWKGLCPQRKLEKTHENPLVIGIWSAIVEIWLDIQPTCFIRQFRSAYFVNISRLNASCKDEYYPISHENRPLSYIRRSDNGTFYSISHGKGQDIELYHVLLLFITYLPSIAHLIDHVYRIGTLRLPVPKIASWMRHAHILVVPLTNNKGNLTYR